MAIALVGTPVYAAPGVHGGTTGSYDTTGANLIIVVVSQYSSGTAATVTDNKTGNTYTETKVASSGGFDQSRIFWCVPAEVGSGHTFTLNGSNTYGVIVVMAFSGASATPDDLDNSGTTGGATTVATGSVSPGEDNELIIAGFSSASAETSISIDNGFTAVGATDWSSGANQGGAAAYKIQTTAAAVNPAWSWVTSAGASATIATFKAGSTVVAGFGIPFPFFLGLMGSEPVTANTATGTCASESSAAGTGAYTAPIYSAAGTCASEAACAGTGTYTAPNYIGTGTCASESSSAGTGVYTAPVYAGDGDCGSEASSSGTGTHASALYTGTGTCASEAACDGTGTYTAPLYTGNGTCSSEASCEGFETRIEFLGLQRLVAAQSSRMTAAKGMRTSAAKVARLEAR